MVQLEVNLPVHKTEVRVRIPNTDSLREKALDEAAVALRRAGDLNRLPGVEESKNRVEKNRALSSVQQEAKIAELTARIRIQGPRVTTGN